MSPILPSSSPLSFVLLLLDSVIVPPLPLHLWPHCAFICALSSLLYLLPLLCLLFHIPIFCSLCGLPLSS